MTAEPVKEFPLQGAAPGPIATEPTSATPSQLLESAVSQQHTRDLSTGEEDRWRSDGGLAGEQGVAPDKPVVQLFYILCELHAPGSLLYCHVSEFNITMAPAKQMGKKVERKDMTRDEKAAEADYQRLVEAAKQQEGRECYW